MLLALALGCWKTDVVSDYTVVPYDHDQSLVDGLVEEVATQLRCPDGSYASFYVVYPEDQSEPAPSALVLHSSAYDYIREPFSENPLVGQNFAGLSEDGHTRLERPWATLKVFETLGMYPRIDLAEDNLGTLAAALLNQGIVGIYPTNCWGDLWHNETPDPGTTGLSLQNDQAAEFIQRNGGALAYDMLQYARGEVTFTSGALLDTDTVYLIGLGDGARGVTELLIRDDTAVAGVLLDSPHDDLESWSAQPGVQEGLYRMYYGSRDNADYNWNTWSMRRLANQGLLPDIPVMLVWSSIDTKVPSGTTESLVTAIEGLPQGCVDDIERAGHVYSNGQIALSTDVVSFLTTGERPSRCDTADE